jgi:GNAT superfamily N-acetyltransferase
MTVGVDTLDFPSPLLIRWEQGMRWRAVLKAVKSIVGEVAGKRVAWRDIHIWASLWENQQAEQEGWTNERAKGVHVMYDILHNGSFVSVGKPTASALGEEEAPFELHVGADLQRTDRQFLQKFMDEVGVKHKEVTPNSTWDYVDTDKGQAGLNLKDTYDTTANSVEIHWLTAQERGSGRAALEHLCKIADKYGVRLMLWAVPLAGQGANKGFSMKQKKLERWYEEFGFKVKRRDQRTRQKFAWMVRNPKKVVVADSHKVTPLMDTMFNEPELGTETNAYADIPERVKGTYDVPSLSTLAPQLFKESAAEGVDYTVEVSDASKGELYCRAEAKIGDKVVGWVNFNEVEMRTELDDERYWRELKDEFGAKEWEKIAEIPKEIWIKMVFVAPEYRRTGIATGMYEKIKQEFPGEKLVSSGTTEEGGKFREKLTERGVLAFKNALLRKSAKKFPSFNQWAKAHPKFDIPADAEHGVHDPSGDMTTRTEIEERYWENTQWLSSLKLPLVIYRALEIEDNPKEFNVDFDNLGIYWTWVENSADTYFGSDSIWNPGTRSKPKKPLPVVVKAVVSNLKDVDLDKTLEANMINPDENEITLRMGAKLKLVGMDWGEGYKVPQGQPHTITAKVASLLQKRAVHEGKQIQHTDHEAVGMTKTLKSNPFANELEALHGQDEVELNPTLDGERNEQMPMAKGEDQINMNKQNEVSNVGMIASVDKNASNVISGEEVVDFICKLNNWTTPQQRQYGYQLVGLDAGGDYILDDEYDLDKLEAGDDYNPAQAEKYAKMKTPLPPIVLDMEGNIRDGNHRVAAAKMRGDNVISAYIPLDTYDPSENA